MKIPKYRRHSSRNLGFVEWKKQRHYFTGLYNSQESIAEYKAFILANVGAVVTPSTAAKPGCTVAVLCKTFLQQHLAQCNGERRGVHGNYLAALKPFCAEYGAEQAATFGPVALRKWRDKLAAKKLARLYVNRCLFYIQNVFRWATSEELVPASVWHGLQSVTALRRGKSEAIEPTKRKPVPWSYIEHILPALTPNVRAMVQLQFHTGARSQSICRACPSQFQREGDLLLWRPRHKTENRSKEELVLPLGPRAQAAIAEFLSGPADQPMFSPRNVRPNPRFRSRYSTETYRDCILQAIDRFNRQSQNAYCPSLPHWTPHQLRHSKGHIVRQLYGVEAAQASLGHDSLSSTQVYSERRLDLAKLVARETG